MQLKCLPLNFESGLVVANINIRSLNSHFRYINSLFSNLGVSDADIMCLNETHTFDYKDQIINYIYFSATSSGHDVII